MMNRSAGRVALTLALSTLWLAHFPAQAAAGQAGMGTHAGMGASGGAMGGMGNAGAQGMTGAKAAGQAMTEGEVRKVDMAAQTITLKHGNITNLNMPGMTMAFKVKNPALLQQVKAGDKVRFSAEMPDGVLTVTAIETAK